MTIGSSRGISVGSEMSAGVRNVTFRDITVLGGQPQGIHERGINIKTQRGRGGIVEDITYTNITIHNAEEAIRITCYYSGSHEGNATNATATPQLRNININNIVSNGATNGWTLDGLPESYIRNVSFSNIQLVNTKNLFKECEYISGTCLHSTVLPMCPPCLQ